MSHLDPRKLYVEFMNGTHADAMEFPRAYTLTHSDSTGDLFLSIGQKFNLSQISGWYTRFMRDEVLAEWKHLPKFTLHVHCHVNGGLVFGSASMRDGIFRQHLPMVLKAFWYGDRVLINTNPHLAQASVLLNFHSNKSSFNKVENWGLLNDYKI